MVRAALLWLGAATLAAAKEELNCMHELEHGNVKNVCEDKFCLKDPRIMQKCDLLGADEHVQKGGGKEGGTNCFDHKDNDGDGKFDCEDEDCLKDPRIKQHCQFVDAKHGGHSKKEGGAACFDHKDNDGDGKCDCDDEDCRDVKGEPAYDVCRTTNHGGCKEGSKVNPEDIKKCPLAGPGETGPDTRYEDKIKEFVKACCNEDLSEKEHGGGERDGGGSRRRTQGMGDPDSPPPSPPPPPGPGCPGPNCVPIDSEPPEPAGEEPEPEGQCPGPTCKVIDDDDKPPPDYVKDLGWCRIPHMGPNARKCSWECAVIFIPSIRDCGEYQVGKELLNLTNAKDFATSCEMAQPSEDIYGDEVDKFPPPPPPPCGYEHEDGYEDYHKDRWGTQSGKYRRCPPTAPNKTLWYGEICRSPGVRQKNVVTGVLEPFDIDRPQDCPTAAQRGDGYLGTECSNGGCEMPQCRDDPWHCEESHDSSNPLSHYPEPAPEPDFKKTGALQKGDLCEELDVEKFDRDKDCPAHTKCVADIAEEKGGPWHCIQWPIPPPEPAPWQPDDGGYEPAPEPEKPPPPPPAPCKDRYNPNGGACQPLKLNDVCKWIPSKGDQETGIPKMDRSGECPRGTSCKDPMTDMEDSDDPWHCINSGGSQPSSPPPPPAGNPNLPTAPEPAPPPPPPLTGSCYQQVAKLGPVMEKGGACCPAGAGCMSHKAEGPPDDCTSTCAKTWNPFYTQCSTTLLDILSSSGKDRNSKTKAITDFAVKCGEWHSGR